MIIGKMFYLYGYKNNLYGSEEYWTSHCRHDFRHCGPGSFVTAYNSRACHHIKLVPSILDKRSRFGGNRVTLFMAMGYLFQEG